MPVKHPKARREDRDYEDLVRLYLEDVGRHDLLTKDDEIRLAQVENVRLKAGTTNISASTPIAAPFSSASPRCRRPRSSEQNRSSSFARSSMAFASVQWKLSTTQSVLIHRKIWNASVPSKRVRAKA
jgi:hypothetical protein